MWSIIESITHFLGNEEYDSLIFDEKIHLMDHAVCINELDSGLFECELRGNYDYLVADPMWIKIRLFLFWIFWAILIIVFIISMFNYWCWLPGSCSEI